MSSHEDIFCEGAYFHTLFSLFSFLSLGYSSVWFFFKYVSYLYL